jgi:tetratricopeptide (TPR) repeat protein
VVTKKPGFWKKDHTMPYELVVETTPDQHTAKFRLLDAHGVQQGSHQVTLDPAQAALWEGLFDTRRHVGRYEGSLLWPEATEPERADDILARLGLFLADAVLGREIMAALTRTRQRRTLLVRLPPTGDDVLAAALARVPWEIARPALTEKTLMERNLVVRVITGDTAGRDGAVAAVAAQVAAGETLRVLLVFAQAPDSRPLAMRRERLELLELFYKEILPRRTVQVEALCHGVTRAVLAEHLRAARGYHVVHWSGHGHHNLLELRGEGGERDLISGEELVALFEEAGGFIPQLVFLSACLSGAFVEIQDWASFQAVLLGQETDKGAQAAPLLPEILENPAGYTGTALALLRSGVPQVVAMRYEVGDAYARELARWFYKRLLADPGRHPTDGALALARGDLLRDPTQAARLGAVNHATPLVFGQAGRLLEPAAKRSPQMAKLRPRPQPLLPGGNRELEQPRHFVGRGAELTRLNVAWLGQDGPAVALVQGLAGMGKTALAAEALHLWHGRFDYVLAFQAKPTRLEVDEFYRRVDEKLTLVSQPYRDKCEEFPFERVHIEPGPRLSGPARYERLRANLVEALRDEALLLVLDNFETNLDPAPGAGGYGCADPEWDHLLGALCRELPATRSRLLLTSRRRPAVLAGEAAAGQRGALRILLGPLPAGEASLYLRSHPGLHALLSSGPEGLELVLRLLRISRGHPLIMNRLAVLSGDRAVLAGALGALQDKGWRTLPDLFAPALSEDERERERAYLEDVAIGSVDFLIERLSPDARALLWMITQANEPLLEDMIAGVWSGRTAAEERLEGLRRALQLLDQLPEEQRPELPEIPPQLQALLEQPAAPDAPPIAPLLAELTQAGLLTADRPAEGAPAYAFHELVRERAAAWMAAHEAERGGRTAEGLWVAYGGRYAALFQQLLRSGQEGAYVAAAEAGRRGLTYLVRAGAFEELGSFASGLVTSTRDPTLLRGIIAELRAVVDHVPAGRERWRLRTYLADALLQSGRPDQALALYEQAAAEAEAAEHWSDVGWICGNWAGALIDVGQLDRAKSTYLRCKDALKKAGRSRVDVILSELEALRVDVMQGQAQGALPEIEARLGEVRGWWRRQRAGEPVPEAPDAVFLGRALVSGLDIARMANQQLERWEACIGLLEEIERAKREMGESKHAQHVTRFNQYGPLLRLGRLDDAQRVAEACLVVFREADDLTGQAKALSALANIWDERGDVEQAIALARQALSIRNRLPDPSDRAMSHGNLANYFYKAGRTEDEARHWLAAGVYFLVSTRRDHLATWLHNLSIRMRRAAESGGRYELPRLAGLLARAEFEALGRFLAGWGVDVAQLQAQLDELVEGVRREAAGPRGLDGLPPELQALFAPLLQAAASGQDVAPLLDELREGLLQAAPGAEQEIDAVLERLRRQLAG